MSMLDVSGSCFPGAVIMDLVADDLTSIVNHVVDQFVITEQLEADNRGAVLQALLLKHRSVTASSLHHCMIFIQYFHWFICCAFIADMWEKRSHS